MLNKNYYVLLSGNLYARTGIAEIHNIVRSFGETVKDTKEPKLKIF
jgi:hypothetical protein